MKVLAYYSHGETSNSFYDQHILRSAFGYTTYSATIHVAMTL
jgi:hypothetical protein